MLFSQDRLKRLGLTTIKARLATNSEEANQTPPAMVMPALIPAVK
jgi:hypothetical protein